MTRRIRIVGEGATELRHVPDRWTGCGRTLVSRLLGQPPTDLVDYDEHVLSKLAARGEAEQARVARLLANRDADGLVLLRDNDRSERRPHGARRPEIERGFLEATLGVRTVPAVLALATECMEAWALADPDAWQRVFDRVPAQLPSEPEAQWGDPRDPTSNHPKCVMARCLAEIGCAGERAVPARLLDRASFEQIARRCPGFARFVDDFHRAFPAIECIVAAGQDRAIDVGGAPPWGFDTLRDYHHHERGLLASNTRIAAVIGHRTWHARRPPPSEHRTDIVVTRDPCVENGAASFDDAVHQAVAAGATRIFVLGGASVYREALSHFRCTAVHYARVDHESPGADAHFPSLDGWSRAGDPSAHHDNGFDYQLERWTRFSPQYSPS